MKHLVALVGFKSSGKNTAAIPLLAHDYVSLSFADSLKDALASIFCWDRDMLEGITLESRAWREEVDTWWAEKLGIPHFTPRWAMMNFGTDMMRRHFHESIWILNVQRKIMSINKSVVLVDCRFTNEILMAKQLNGMIVRIKRGPEPDWIDIARHANIGSEIHLSKLKELGIHESEFNWLGTPFQGPALDATIENDGTIQELHAKVLQTCPIR